MPDETPRDYPREITLLQRQLADLRFQLEQKTHEVELLRTELADLRPRVSNQEHHIARLKAANAALSTPSTPLEVVPNGTPATAADAEPQPTDPAPAALAATDRFHNGG